MCQDNTKANIESQWLHTPLFREKSRTKFNQNLSTCVL